MKLYLTKTGMPFKYSSLTNFYCIIFRQSYIEKHTPVCNRFYCFFYFICLLGVQYENTEYHLSNLNKKIQGAHSSTRSDTNKAYVDLPPDVDLDEKIHQENPYGDMYVNEQFSPDILIKDIGSVIMKKRKTENDGFKKEYAVSFLATYAFIKGLYIEGITVFQRIEEMSYSLFSVMLISSE